MSDEDGLRMACVLKGNERFFEVTSPIPERTKEWTTSRPSVFHVDGRCCQTVHGFVENTELCIFDSFYKFSAFCCDFVYLLLFYPFFSS